MIRRAATVLAVALAGVLLDDTARGWVAAALAVAGVICLVRNVVTAVRLWRGERARNKRRDRHDPTAAPKGEYLQITGCDFTKA